VSPVRAIALLMVGAAAAAFAPSVSASPGRPTLAPAGGRIASSALPATIVRRATSVTAARPSLATSGGTGTSVPLRIVQSMVVEDAHQHVFVTGQASVGSTWGLHSRSHLRGGYLAGWTSTRRSR
jgi:hypothetical protein